ncbi:MAG: hypothetical protein ACXV5F_06295 [Halobacteriota archaeon]
MTVTIPEDVYAALDIQTEAVGGNRSHVVTLALESYLSDNNKTRQESGDMTGDMTEVLQNKITELERVIAAKDETIQSLNEAAKRYENIAGFYGTESSKVIDKLATISDALTRLLPAAKTEHTHVDEDETVTVTLPSVESTNNEPSLSQRVTNLFRRGPKNRRRGGA